MITLIIDHKKMCEIVNYYLVNEMLTDAHIHVSSVKQEAGISGVGRTHFEIEYIETAEETEYLPEEGNNKVPK